jgi:hypothetical protein
MTFRSMMMGAAVMFLLGCPRPTTKPDAGCVGITCPTGGGIGAGGGSGGGTGGGTTGGGTGGGTTGGGTGGGTTGGGTGGGTTGGGTGGGGGIPTTIQAAKGSSFPTRVTLQNVVVTAISFARVSAASTNCAHLANDGGLSKGVNASFWIADQNSPQSGVWVNKFRCDGDVDYFPQVGDVLNVDGIIGFQSSFTQEQGYRIVVKSEFDYIPSKPGGYVCELSSTPVCEPLVITKTGTMAPLSPIDVPISFGANGAIKAEPTYSGARVHIAGPLTVGDINPEALHRQSSLGAADTRYFGFGLSNGVLVDNVRTFDGVQLEDGGVSHCDVRFVVGDGGTVTFPNGIIGVWDTYTMASCTDGGTSLTSCFNNRGTVPGATPLADGGLPNYTNVLYPTDCADMTP